MSPNRRLIDFTISLRGAVRRDLEQCPADEHRYVQRAASDELPVVQRCRAPPILVTAPGGPCGFATPMLPKKGRSGMTMTRFANSAVMAFLRAAEWYTARPAAFSGRSPCSRCSRNQWASEDSYLLPYVARLSPNHIHRARQMCPPGPLRIPAHLVTMDFNDCCIFHRVCRTSQVQRVCWSEALSTSRIS